jgi:hypothetical protein
MPESSIIANDPNHSAGQYSTDEVEAQVKAELLKELSVDDIRQMISLAKSGFSSVRSEDLPDTFDEYGRNFRRKLHRMKKIGPSGNLYYEDRPMALSLEEARSMKPAGDYFDSEEKVWILRGVKRQRDYPENTVGFWEETNGAVVPA